MIPAELIQKIDNARMELSECTSREGVEKVFSEFGITGYRPKIALLRRCMKILKTKETQDTAENDEAAYEDHLAIFLAGEWKKTNLYGKPEIPASGSVLSSADAKRQSKKSILSVDKEKSAKDSGVPENDSTFFQNFFKANITPRMKKKYLTQLISVVQDMIAEKICEWEEKQKTKPENSKTGRYRITLIEFKSESGWKGPNARSICFPHFSVIFYNPSLDVATINASIAHELGHLLMFYGVIQCNDASVEKYANLFASFALNDENSL